MQGNSESVFRSNYQAHHVAEKLMALGFGRFVKPFNRPERRDFNLADQLVNKPGEWAAHTGTHYSTVGPTARGRAAGPESATTQGVRPRS
ncbi:hypothetical protein GGTG_04690 [Gaeumannomyces tritici R3-111a-1]|uniref:Uncharacterized protein n=1 Tax=Gaeumannomyces tritici (strain R3-111a-1) TaxID=644352 RepID=J3NTU1_GAET3|nr:hypothetical protein GGTG_04690 [Gaeumannomyces tritici R3-111a-1]EJT79606.1 hypothetical protein GGTG_04690 [Gaeumannomyces tritici R3-111a-1]